MLRRDPASFVDAESYAARLSAAYEQLLSDDSDYSDLLSSLSTKVDALAAAIGNLSVSLPNQQQANVIPPFAERWRSKPITRFRTDSRSICFRCNRTGHIQRNCPERVRFTRTVHQRNFDSFQPVEPRRTRNDYADCSPPLDNSCPQRAHMCDLRLRNDRNRQCISTSTRNNNQLSALTYYQREHDSQRRMHSGAPYSQRQPDREHLGSSNPIRKQQTGAPSARILLTQTMTRLDLVDLNAEVFADEIPPINSVHEIDLSPSAQERLRESDMSTLVETATETREVTGRSNSTPVEAVKEAVGSSIRKVPVLSNLDEKVINETTAQDPSSTLVDVENEVHRSVIHEVPGLSKSDETIVMNEATERRSSSHYVEVENESDRSVVKEIPVLSNSAFPKAARSRASARFCKILRGSAEF